MSSSLEQHFEGTAPRKSRRWIVLLAAVAIVAMFVVFARATLPSQRREFVGVWTEAKRPQFFYDFKPDGSFSAVIQNEWVGNNLIARIAIKGTWKASHEALYLTYTSMEPPNKSRRPQDFDLEAQKQIGKEIRFRVDWVAKDQFRIGDMWDWTFQRNP